MSKPLAPLCFVYSLLKQNTVMYVVQVWNLCVCVHIICICILMSAVCESVLVFSRYFCCGPHLFPFQVRCASSS